MKPTDPVSVLHHRHGGRHQPSFNYLCSWVCRSVVWTRYPRISGASAGRTEKTGEWIGGFSTHTWCGRWAQDCQLKGGTWLELLTADGWVPRNSDPGEHCMDFSGLASQGRHHCCSHILLVKRSHWDWPRFKGWELEVTLTGSSHSHP